MSKCLGCGVKLQTTNPLLEGYIPAESLDKQICMRCFKLTHYGTYQSANVPDNEAILKTINAQAKYGVFLCDFLNINAEIIKVYHQIKVPKCLVISKCDYIPKDINLDKITVWLQETYQIREEIYYISSNKDYNIHLLEKIMTNQHTPEIYLMGFTNAGKSTLVNKLLNSNQITISSLPNTTRDFIQLNFLNHGTLIDSPGFQYQESIIPENALPLLKKLAPKSYLRPITFQLKANASIIIENLIRITNLSNQTNLTIYMSNNLTYQKVYEKNNALTDLPFNDYQFLPNQDLVIKGLGFINVKTASNLRVYIAHPSLLETRPSLF